VYFEKFFTQLPKTIRSALVSPRSSSYIVGLAKSHDIELDNAPEIAFLILQICLGEKKLEELSRYIAESLEISKNKAETISLEIQNEFFAPLQSELSQYLKTLNVPKTPITSLQKPSILPPAPSQEPRNVINLKERLPAPPPSPRPPARSAPPR
jgi:hypothetical protein